MSGHRLPLLVVLATIFVVGPLAWIVLRPWSPPSPPQRAVAATLQWQPGTRQLYRVEVDSTVLMRTAGQAVDGPMKHEVRGTLTVETLAVVADEATVAMQLDPVELLVSGVVDADSSLALATPFEVRFDAGMPIAFTFPLHLQPEYRQQLEQLVRTFQLTVRGEQEWQVEESHGTGTYLASYVRSARGDIRRTKLGYRDPQRAADAPAVEVRRSELVARLEPEVDWLASMKVHEQLATTTELGMAFEVATEATLERLCDAELATAMLQAASGSPAADAVAAAARTARQASPMIQASAAELDLQVRELVAALDAASDDRIEWIHRLRDLIRGDHRVPPLLLAVLRDQPQLLDRTRADLYLAFELGATDAAQAALCRVALEPDWQLRDRTRALIALGGVATPSEASLTTLWTAMRDRSTVEARDCANTAVLAIGALAGRMDQIGDADYANLRGGLLSAAWGARDAKERAVVVLALGNTGDPSLAEEVLPFLDDGAVGVRRAAARTLGKLGGERAAIELGLRLANEANSGVRAAMAGALAACGSVPPELIVQVRGSILTESDEAARLAMARLLARDVAESPENVVVLRQLLDAEQSSRVRRYVGEALARFEAAEARTRPSNGR